MGSYRFILSGGGTGGHVYPAIAIANELKRRYADAEFLFVGAKGKMEMDKVPQAGYKIVGLWISGLQRKLTIKNMMFPIKLISSLLRARKIVKQFQPDVVIGTGGFASGPVVRVAAGKGIPCLLQEQNSYAGITNKLLAKKARKICVAYDGMERYFPEDKLVLTGNPVREDLVALKMSKAAALKYFKLDPKQPVVVVLGGSLGARRINQLIESRLPFFKEQQVQVLWQCGKLYYQDYSKFEAPDVRVKAFLERMEAAYAVADVIVSRAGAGTVSELCLAGKPVIFIPSPNVAEDHQDEEELEKSLDELLRSKELREQLGDNIKAMALPKATHHIVDEIEKLLG